MGQSQTDMNIVYLNGDYLPMHEARISPMDRGYLFGDGVYEVIPSYGGRLVGFEPHMARMQRGLDELEIDFRVEPKAWREVARQLVERNEGDNLALYIHISRGAESRRYHAYPLGIAPTVFAFVYEIPPPPAADKSHAPRYRVVTAEDMRWRRCHIKSTALLGNVMHYQHGAAGGHDEVILYNALGEVTEAAACNVYVVRDGAVATPPLDHQILPGITRQMLLDILRRDGSIPVQERNVTREELMQADEVWLSSSSRDLVPVVEVDGVPVADGDVGDVWLAAQTLYAEHKFDY